MEHRYYLSPGQTLENTKIVDRGQGLHMTTGEWKRLEKHLDRNKDIREELERVESKRKYLQEGNENMIKNWDNSLENIRLRKEEARLKRIEDLKEERTRRFFELRAEQAEIRKEYVDKVRKKMFIESGWAKNINTAFIAGEVYFEREKQIEFKNMVKKHDEEVEAEYAKLVKKNAKDEEDEKAAKEKELYENRKETGVYLRKIIAENEEKARIEEETRIRKESLDNLKAIKEMEVIRKHVEDQRAKEKREMLLDKQKHLKSIEELKKQLKQEEKEMDDVLAIYREAKHDIECLKRESLAEKQDAIIARREYVASLVAGKQAQKLEEEEQRRLVAAAEKDALEDEKNKAKADFRENIRKERLESWNECQEKKKEAQRKETELKKWEMANRYRIAEYTKEYELEKKKKLWRNILNRRKELLEQMDEKEKQRLESKEIDDCLSQISFEKDDAKFFDYADEVIEMAKKKGRSVYPIEKVVLEYKKFYSLMPEGKKCTTCEDYHNTGEGTSHSRDLIQKSVKKKTCKCGHTTMENTKVLDRGQGLHMTQNEWHRIQKHLDRNKDIQDDIDRVEARRKYLDEGSKNMIKNWDNSLENIRKRKEEARLRKLESIQEDRLKRFFELTAEQDEIRKTYVAKARRQIFLDSGWAKDMNSAMVTTEVLFEREKQKEFKKFIKNHEKEEDAEYAQLVKQNAINEAEEKAAEKKKLYEERQERGRYLRKVIEENEAKHRMEEETRIRKESVDNMKSINEIEFLKRKQEEQIAKEKREMLLEKQKYLKSIEDLKAQLKQEEKEMDDVLEIYQNAKREIDCMKKEKEAEKQAAIVARRELVAKMVSAGEAAIMEAEEKCIKKALAEREALEEEKLRLRAEYDARMRQERLDNRNQYRERKKEEDRQAAEMKKWEMVNRYKIEHFTKEYEEKKKQQLWQNILKRRKELLEQIAEDEEQRKLSKEIDDCLSKVSFADDDAKFFEYADEVLELAKKKGRSTYPIEKVIFEYKKMYSLLPEPKKCTTCEHTKIEDKKSLSRELINNSVVRRGTCRCQLNNNK